MQPQGGSAGQQRRQLGLMLAVGSVAAVMLCHCSLLAPRTCPALPQAPPPLALTRVEAVTAKLKG
jgi:hypothetical protein